MTVASPQPENVRPRVKQPAVEREVVDAEQDSNVSRTGAFYQASLKLHCPGFIRA